MRRQDVKHGVEYAVRVGNYGRFARILILGEMTRERPGRWSHSPPIKEGGLEGRVIEGYYRIGFGSAAMEKGDTGFVRGRDISHLWQTEESQKANDARLASELTRAKVADEAERRRLAEGLEALGLEGGIAVLQDGYGYKGPARQVGVNRDALLKLVEMAEAGS